MKLFRQSGRIGRNCAFLLDAGSAESGAGPEIAAQLFWGTGGQIIDVIAGALIEEGTDKTIPRAGCVQRFYG